MLEQLESLALAGDLPKFGQEAIDGLCLMMLCVLSGSLLGLK